MSSVKDLNWLQSEEIQSHLFFDQNSRKCIQSINQSYALSTLNQFEVVQELWGDKSNGLGILKEFWPEKSIGIEIIQET